MSPRAWRFSYGSRVGNAETEELKIDLGARGSESVRRRV